MRCKDFQELLLEYRDGELDGELAASMQLHMGNCKECAAALRELEAEGKVCADYRETLEKDLDVDGAMWSGVLARIAPAGDVSSESRRAPGVSTEGQDRIRRLWRQRIFRQAAMAAALVFVTVAATLVAVRYLDSGKARPATAGGAARPPVTMDGSNRSAGEEKSLEGAMRAIRRAEQEYIDAIGILSDILDKRKATLDPRLALELDRNLRAIDESIEATRKAYYAHPSDPYLAVYMLTSYSRKVELLQEITS